jgi:hypothetical protein
LKSLRAIRDSPSLPTSSFPRIRLATMLPPPLVRIAVEMACFESAR